MTKAPAFQFYVRDWLTDPQLRLTSCSTRGIWADLLCYMWIAPERGELSTDVEKLRRMVGANQAEIDLFVDEAVEMSFCDISVTRNEKIKNRYAKITVRNRRMYRDEKVKKNNRKRQQRHRDKQQNNADNNSEITHTSATASATALNNDLFTSVNKSAGSRHFKDKMPDEIADEIKWLCERGNRLPAKNGHDFNFFQFVQMRINNSDHPAAIVHTIKRIIKYWPTIGNPWKYGPSIAVTESKNFNEKDHITQAQEFKEAMKTTWTEFLRDPKVAGLTAGIGKKIKN